MEHGQAEFCIVPVANKNPTGFHAVVFYDALQTIRLAQFRRGFSGAIGIPDGY